MKARDLRHGKSVAKKVRSPLMEGFAGAKQVETLVWLSFDLGIQGDYEGLYAWLDSHKAKECGANVACFSYNHSGSLVESLRRELGKSMQLSKRARLYVIYRNAEGKLVGTFVRGLRKSPPWAGFGSLGESAEDTDA